VSTNQPQHRFFFVGYAAFLLAIVLIGFSPTLYLRFLGDPPPIPGYLYLHGIILTVWFVWLVIQTWLIRQRNVALHRKLGFFGACFGVVVIAGGLMATLGVVPRFLELGVTLDMDVNEALAIAGTADTDTASEVTGATGVTALEFGSIVVWSNLQSVVAFGVMLGVAVLCRHRPDVHKRFMLLASVSIVGPALARISRWPFLGGEVGPFTPTMLLVLIGAIVIYDLASIRKVHWATLAGAGIGVLFVVIGSAIAGSDFGQEFVRRLG
jgi:hypothetical protein